MVRNQEAAAKRSDDLHFVAHLHIAQVVGAGTAHCLALMVLQHALDG